MCLTVQGVIKCLIIPCVFSENLIMKTIACTCTEEYLFSCLFWSEVAFNNLRSHRKGTAGGRDLSIKPRFKMLL